MSRLFRITALATVVAASPPLCEHAWACENVRQPEVLPASVIADLTAGAVPVCLPHPSCRISEATYSASLARYFTEKRIRKHYAPWVPAEQLEQVIHNPNLARDFPTALALAQEDFKRAHGDAARTCLEPHEHAAIWGYSAATYSFLNTALRNRKKPLSEEEKTLIGVLNCGLDRLPGYRGLASRWVNIAHAPQGFLEAHAPGAIVRYAAFTSASHCVEQKAGKQFLIHSLHGKRIGDYSGLDDSECEVLFKPGTCFKVNGRFKTDEHPLKALVDMTEVPCPASGSETPVAEF